VTVTKQQQNHFCFTIDVIADEVESLIFGNALVDLGILHMVLPLKIQLAKRLLGAIESPVKVDSF